MYRIYQVQNGETLDTIAKDFDVTAVLIRELNGFPEGYMVVEGERIVVPNESGNFQRYKVVKGDTLYSIASRYDISVAELAMLNGLDESDYIYTDQIILVPKEDISFYITKENDTLSGVANYFKTIPETLVKQNRTIYLMPDQLVIYKKEKL